MGTRVRLKANYDIEKNVFSDTARKFLRAFKKYGLILADNGGASSGFNFQGEYNTAWFITDIDELKRVPASAFEAIGP